MIIAIKNVWKDILNKACSFNATPYTLRHGSQLLGIIQSITYGGVIFFTLTTTSNFTFLTRLVGDSGKMTRIL